jgi:general secretion pathway protein A
MYVEYFGLKKRPFSIVPDPACFYVSEGHREALAHLLYGATGDGGFVLLTGEVGTGKTTVCRRLFELAPETTDVAFILNPKLSAEELLATICDEFGIGCPEGTTSIRTLVARINDYLLNAHDKGRRAVLIVEEAQNLTPEVLEQIRLLTNLETNQRKLLQVVMIGQPELREMLAKPRLRQLSQRITARYHLGPLSREEVPEYINHRLAAAGAGRSRLFPPATIRKVYGLTRGVPRLINVVCDRALLGTFVQEKERVDIKTLKKAAREVMAEEYRSGRKRLYRAAAGVLFLLCIALGTFYHMSGSRRWASDRLHTRAEEQASEKTRLAINHSLRPRPEQPFVASGAETAPAIAGRAVDGRRAASVTEAAAAPPAGIADGGEVLSAGTTTLGRPAGQSLSGTREMAYRALCRQWHVPYYTGADRPLVCDQVESAGLKCLMGKGDIGNLREMNRPAVLQLTDKTHGDYYAVLTSLDGQRATFMLGDGTRTVDAREVAQCWSGDYLLLWRAPPGYEGTLQPGSRGPAVAWLTSQLALAQGREAPAGENRVYDEKVKEQVKEFQIAARMTPDGVAGPRTILRLSNASPDSRDPVLRAARSGKGTN